MAAVGGENLSLVHFTLTYQTLKVSFAVTRLNWQDSHAGNGGGWRRKPLGSINWGLVYPRVRPKGFFRCDAP
jgi:hypothetical protein